MADSAEERKLVKVSQKSVQQSKREPSMCGGSRGRYQEFPGVRVRQHESDVEGGSEMQSWWAVRRMRGGRVGGWGEISVRKKG